MIKKLLTLIFIASTALGVPKGSLTGASQVIIPQSGVDYASFNLATNLLGPLDRNAEIITPTDAPDYGLTAYASTEYRYFSLGGYVIIKGEIIPLTAYSFPDMVVTEPTTNYPVTFADFSPTVTNRTPYVGSPEIAEWTRQNDPGDTMALTGEDLEDDFAGFWYYSEGAAGFGDIQRLDGRQAAVTLPDNLTADDFYLMWPLNGNGFGYPVGINQTDAKWLSFDNVVTGETFYVYGASLSLDGDSCWVWNDTEEEWLESTTNTNPYKAEFVVPSDWAEGTHTLYSHNGHGGKYGWADPLDLLVESAATWNTNVYNVEDYGADGSDGNSDQTGIEAAFAAAEADRGSTVYFPAGTYYATNEIVVDSNLRYLGDGMTNTFITFHSSTGDADLLLVRPDWPRSYDIKIEGLSFLSSDYGKGDTQVLLGYITGLELIDVGFSTENVTDADDNGCVSFQSGYDLKATGCEFKTSELIYFGAMTDVRVTDCTFIGIDDVNQFTAMIQAKRLDFSGCTVKNDDMSTAETGDGWSKGRWLTATSTMTELYVGGNETIDQAPRRSTPFVNTNATSVGAYHNEGYVPGFGTFGEQDISIPIDDKYHDMKDDYTQWRGYSAKAEWVVDGVPGGDEYTYVKTIDASNDVVTIRIIDYEAPGWPTTYDSMTVTLSDIVDANSSEQILFEGVPSWFSASPISSTATVMTFADTSAIEYVDYDPVRNHVSITQGRGLGQFREVIDMDSDAGTVTISKPWNVIPDETSVVNFGSFAKNVIIYDNIFDGRIENVTNKSASAAIQVYGNGAGVIFAENRLSELRSGIAYMVEGYSGYTPDVSVRSANMFSLVSGNSFTSCWDDVYMNEQATSGGDNNNDAVRNLGHVFRDNTSIGSLNSLYTINSETSLTNSAFNLNVYQDNTYSNFVDSIDEEGEIANQVWIGNTFYGDGGTGYTICSNHVPAFQGNTWNGFATTFGGDLPGPVIELPVRAGYTNEAEQTIAVYNSGTTSTNLTALGQTKAIAAESSADYTFTATTATNFPVGPYTYYVIAVEPEPESVILASVAISGDSSVDAGTTNTYTLTGTYSDASTSNVTTLASWSEDNTNTTIGAATGILIVGDLVADEDVHIIAAYGGIADTNTISLVAGSASSTNDYIELNGSNSYFNVDLVMGTNLTIEVVARYLAINSATEQFLFGTFSGADYGILEHYGNFRSRDNYSVHTIVSSDTNTYHTFTFDPYDTQTASVGTNVYTFAGTSFSSGDDLDIGRNGDEQTYYSNVRIKSVKIWDEGVLVRDYSAGDITGTTNLVDATGNYDATLINCTTGTEE